MRDLKEDELEKVTKKLKLFIGDNIDDLLENHKLSYNQQRVLLVTEKLIKSVSQITSKEIISAGSIIGKFTKTNKFKITITGFHSLEKYALNKVWIKSSAEMNFLYGNNALKSHIFKISESVPMNSGIFVYNQDDLGLGFGITAVSPTSYERARSGDIVILRQGDNGEYLRSETQLA